jgi:hypothetical protein
MQILRIHPVFEKRSVKCDFWCRSILAQQDKTGMNTPIGYAGRMLKGAENN